MTKSTLTAIVSATSGKTADSCRFLTVEKGGEIVTPKKTKALAALLNSPTRAAAAKAAGVGETTLRSWLRDDAEFKQAYRDALGELMETANARAKKRLVMALDVLADVMYHGENGQVRVSAARSTLEYALRLNDVVEDERRIADLEAMLDKLEGDK